jgi:hypothetical protein
VLAITPGCKTLVGNDVDAYRLGRIVTVTYLATKDKANPDYVKAVETVYAEFDRLLSAVNDECDHDSFKKLLLQELENNMDGEDAQYVALLSEIVDLYWERLNQKYDIDKFIPKEQIELLKQFNGGVKAALVDYTYLHN